MIPEWAERFWDKVEVTSYHWWWRAGTFEDRYGQRGYGAFQLDGRTRRAHHIMWMLTKGPIPTGLWVLHHCDEPSCVSPAHLYLGTPKDNSADRERRHRRCIRRGEEHGSAVLTQAAVDDIRARYWSIPRVASNATELAERYGISRSHVRNIVRRERWSAS